MGTMKAMAVMFQSTPLREGRLFVGRMGLDTARRFNPRPCVRGDFKLSRHEERLLVFQSTPLREGRPGRLVMARGRCVFQSTPLREGRLPL